jgi:hypothetical protein
VFFETGFISTTWSFKFGCQLNREIHQFLLFNAKDKKFLKINIKPECHADRYQSILTDIIKVSLLPNDKPSLIQVKIDIAGNLFSFLLKQFEFIKLKFERLLFFLVFHKKWLSPYSFI